MASQGGVEKRTCASCKVEKSRSEYYADRRKVGGIRYECKACFEAKYKAEERKRAAGRMKWRAWRRRQREAKAASEKARKKAARVEWAREPKVKEARPGWRVCVLCGEEKEESRFRKLPFGPRVRRVCRTCQGRWRSKYGTERRKLREKGKWRDKQRRYRARKRERERVEAEWAEERELWQKLGEWGQLQL